MFATFLTTLVVMNIVATAIVLAACTVSGRSRDKFEGLEMRPTAKHFRPISTSAIDNIEQQEAVLAHLARVQRDAQSTYLAPVLGSQTAAAPM